MYSSTFNSCSASAEAMAIVSAEFMAVGMSGPCLEEVRASTYEAEAEGVPLDVCVVQREEVRAVRVGAFLCLAWSPGNGRLVVDTAHIMIEVPQLAGKAVGELGSSTEVFRDLFDGDTPAVAVRSASQRNRVTLSRSNRFDLVLRPTAW